MEILECPLYKECKEEECPYFENEDCTYYIKKEQDFIPALFLLCTNTAFAFLCTVY